MSLQKFLRDQFLHAKEFSERIKKKEAEQEKEFEACVKKMMDAASKKTNDELRKREKEHKIRIMDAKQQCDRLIAHKGNLESFEGLKRCVHISGSKRASWISYQSLISADYYDLTIIALAYILDYLWFLSLYTF